MAFSYSKYSESDNLKKRKADADSHSTYKESDTVLAARDALNQHKQNQVADWTGGTYGQSLKDTMDKINNREKFSYDLNGDMLYQQYKDQYMRQGKLAMQDTMGQAAALTGGYGNSYATTAASQAYQGYMQQLNDKVPELYQLAYDRYNQEGQDLYNQYSLYNQAYGTEYGEYRDNVNDWNTRYDQLYGEYSNESNADYNRFASDRDYYTGLYQADRDYEYNLYSDAYDRALKEYQLANSGSGGSGRSGGSSSGSSSSYMNSEAYLNAIRKKYGTEAANDELNRLIANGDITGEKNIALAAIQARGGQLTKPMSDAEKAQYAKTQDLKKKAASQGISIK